jgi:hypothetical protein
LDIDKLIEKIKCNWKRILMIGVSAYVGFTILSMVTGVFFFTKIKNQVENEKEALGQEFQTRKEDFRERFNKNWNEGLDKLAKGFAESEKKRNKHALDLGKRLIESHKEDLNGKWYIPSQTDKKELQKKLLQESQDLAISEAAYKKKWFSQREDETIEQCERRRDEGEIDWYLRFIKECERRMEGITDEIEWENAKEEIDRYREELQSLQDCFQKKYDEYYEDIEFQKLCAVLKEQAQKEVQEFLDGIAAKEAENERKEELVRLMRTRDWVVSGEEDAHSSSKNTYSKLWKLQKLIVKYGKYNALKAAFEKKWNMEADEPLEKLKADCKNDPHFRESDDVKWEHGSGDYHKKAINLKERLPEMEKELDTKSIEDLRQRIPKEEERFKRWQKKLEAEENLYKVTRRRITKFSVGKSRDDYEEEEMEKEKARLEKLQLRPSLAALEEAFQKKWILRGADETEEAYKRRFDEGEIQFLTALVEREKIDNPEHSSKEKQYFKTYKSHLEELEEEFLEKYGEKCPMIEIVFTKDEDTKGNVKSNV